MKKIISLFLEVKNFLFPDFCVLCGCSLSGDEIRLSLCVDCRDSLVPVQGDRCRMCGKPLVSEKETCLSCRNGAAPSCDRLCMLFPYIGKYRKLLASYKFGKKTALADFFAEKVLEAKDRNLDLKEASIVPVPPRPGKIKSGGWDQVDFLVKRIKKIGKERVSVYRCLKRRKSKVQKRLNRTDRMENLKGRIFMDGAAPKTALIIDDVMTTGSTIEVCSAELKKGGAEKVYGLCLFYD
jgi:ComF family protein